MTDLTPIKPCLFERDAKSLDRKHVFFDPKQLAQQTADCLLELKDGEPSYCWSCEDAVEANYSFSLTLENGVTLSGESD